MKFIWIKKYFVVEFLLKTILLHYCSVPYYENTDHEDHNYINDFVKYDQSWYYNSFNVNIILFYWPWTFQLNKWI